MGRKRKQIVLSKSKAKIPKKNALKEFYEEKIKGSIFWKYNPAKGL